MDNNISMLFSIPCFEAFVEIQKLFWEESISMSLLSDKTLVNFVYVNYMDLLKEKIFDFLDLGDFFFFWCLFHVCLLCPLLFSLLPHICSSLTRKLKLLT